MNINSVNTDPTDPNSPFYDPTLDPLSTANVLNQVPAVVNTPAPSATDDSTNPIDAVKKGKRHRRHARLQEDLKTTIQNTQPTIPVEKTGKIGQ